MYATARFFRRGGRPSLEIVLLSRSLLTGTGSSQTYSQKTIAVKLLANRLVTIVFRHRADSGWNDLEDLNLPRRYQHGRRDHAIAW